VRRGHILNRQRDLRRASDVGVGASYTSRRGLARPSAVAPHRSPAAAATAMAAAEAAATGKEPTPGAGAEEEPEQKPAAACGRRSARGGGGDVQPGSPSVQS
jgi:hypothetical protein